MSGRRQCVPPPRDPLPRVPPMENPVRALLLTSTSGAAAVPCWSSPRRSHRRIRRPQAPPRPPASASGCCRRAEPPELLATPTRARYSHGAMTALISHADLLRETFSGKVRQGQTIPVALRPPLSDNCILSIIPCAASEEQNAMAERLLCC